MLKPAAAFLLCAGMAAAAPALAQPSALLVAGAAGSAAGTMMLVNVDDARGPERRERDAWYWGWYGTGQDRKISRDRGYFAQYDTAPLVSEGHAIYDYDRGYPYDFYPYYSAPSDDAEIDYEAERAQSCETEWTRDRRSGDSVPVTICRN